VSVQAKAQCSEAQARLRDLQAWRDKAKQRFETLAVEMESGKKEVEEIKGKLAEAAAKASRDREEAAERSVEWVLCGAEAGPAMLNWWSDRTQSEKNSKS